MENEKKNEEMSTTFTQYDLIRGVEISNELYGMPIKETTNLT